VTASRLLLLIACGVGFVLFALYPLPLADKLAAVPYGIDPQRPSHTYVVGGALLPLEARKTGMFGGFLLSYLFMLARGRRRAAAFPPWRLTALLVAGFAAMALDGMNATFYDVGWPHLYTPDLRLRLATGLLAGLAMAAVLIPAVNGVVWRDIVNVPSLANSREMLAALAILAAFFFLVDARLPVLFDPIAILSVAGLIAELVFINVVLVLAASNRIGVANSMWDALPVAVAGLCLAATELLLMSIIRYLALGDFARYM
jgi:hypothetical protein